MTPFWQPWGIWGFLWRFFAFLGGMVLISLLLSALIKGCSQRNNEREFNKDRDIPPELVDSTRVPDWGDSIPGVPELPPPDSNYIPPVDTSRIITNPEDSTGQIVAGQLIVFFNSNNLKADMTTFAQQFKAHYPSAAWSIIYYNPQAGTMLLSVPEDQMMQAVQEIPQKITGIDYIITTNDVLRESGKPSDGGFSQASYDEYFRLIQTYEAWDITKGSPDVRVAIIDSYFDLTHPEIGERYVDRIHIPSKTVNVMPPSTPPASQNDLATYCHGSHVAGIAIGAQNNGIGVSGIAPECTWIPIALGNQMTSFNLIEAILYAVYHNADVINISIGRAFPEGASQIPLADQVTISKTNDLRGEQLMEYVYKVACDHNCVICTSAGNESLLMGLDPKKRSNSVIKVEAVDGKGKCAAFSNFGTVPEANINYSTVAAPGVNIWSATDRRCIPMWNSLGYRTSQSEGLQEMSGTSMSSPVVAGAVALLKSKNKDLTPEQIINILKMTGRQTDTQHRIGPTIQIRDALDATSGGEKMNFDDVMKNHDLLIGTWRSTYELQLANSNGESIDDIWVYFTFTSSTSGYVEMRAVNSQHVYRADCTVQWGTNSFTIVQHGDAVSADGDAINHDDYTCRPDANRLLEASTVRNGKVRYTFMLERVK